MSDRIENRIVFALRKGKPGFCFNECYYDLYNDKKWLQGVLDLSLRQMWSRLYYGMFNQETIEAAKVELDNIAKPIE